MTVAAGDADEVLAARAESEAGDGVAATVGDLTSGAAMSVPDLAAPTRPVSVSRFSRFK